MTEQTTDRLMDRLRADRALTVVRAERIPDAVELCEALAAGGLGLVELTFTTPDVLSHVGKAAAAGLPIGVGTVMTAEQARSAVDAGATFLVTPGLRPDVARVAADAAIPVFLGAFTPTEVAAAVDLGAAAVKIFPAGRLGPKYLSDPARPLPGRRVAAVRRDLVRQCRGLPGRRCPGGLRRHQRCPARRGRGRRLV